MEKNGEYIMIFFPEWLGFSIYNITEKIYFFKGTVGIISSVCMKIDCLELLLVYESYLWIFAGETRKNLAKLTPAIFISLFPKNSKGYSG